MPVVARFDGMTVKMYLRMKGICLRIDNRR